MLLLDTTIVNNAQVNIRVGLDANLTQIQWVLDSYILAYAVLLLSFGQPTGCNCRPHWRSLALGWGSPSPP